MLLEIVEYQIQDVFVSQDNRHFEFYCALVNTVQFYWHSQLNAQDVHVMFLDREVRESNLEVLKWRRMHFVKIQVFEQVRHLYDR